LSILSQAPIPDRALREISPRRRRGVKHNMRAITSGMVQSAVTGGWPQLACKTPAHERV